MLVLQFPLPNHRQSRPSAKTRGDPGLAASSASRSAVKPADRAFSVVKIEDHHSAGIASRCGHLRTAATVAPISAAKASGDDHSATTSRKLETDEVMDMLIGQSVLKSKPILSHDWKMELGNTCPMGKVAGATAYLQEFTTRVYSAREHARRTQEDVAHALQTTQTTYSKYETRSLLPHRHIRTFCLICQISVEWLVTGQGRGVPLLAKPEPKHRPGRRARKPARAA